jgi:O-acetyl-ADP-ribose deacetylase (regulator of RNase III)
MKLKFTNGNLLDMAEQGQFDVIVHGCNCFSTMGAGIAKQIADRYPKAALADRMDPRTPGEKLGQFTYVSIASDKTSHHARRFDIVNAYTQYGMSSNGECVFDYAAFVNILQTLHGIYGPNPRFGFPYIGMGLAGGNQNTIIYMLEYFGTMCDTTLVAYE